MGNLVVRLGDGNMVTQRAAERSPEKTAKAEAFRAMGARGQAFAMDVDTNTPCKQLLQTAKMKCIKPRQRAFSVSNIGYV